MQKRNMYSLKTATLAVVSEKISLQKTINTDEELTEQNINTHC
jgi:hypothetical protein